MSPSLRASNETLPRARVARAVRDSPGDPSLFSILKPVAVPCGDGYHATHAIHLDPHRPAHGTQPHRRHDHPSRTGCNNSRPNRLDALSHRNPDRSCLPRQDRMDLDRHGLRHLWNGRIGVRPLHPRQHPGRTGREWRPASRQRDERNRKLFAGPVRRARVSPRIVGDRASRIPSSQSSVPFFIFTTLIRSNPASVNQAFVSAAE